MGLVTLTFDLLTLQLVCESHDRIKGRDLRSEFGHAIGLRVLQLFTMYATDGRTDGRTKAKLTAPFPAGGGIISRYVLLMWSSFTVRLGILSLVRGRCYYAPAPVGEAGALGGHRRLSSVCPSVRPSVCLTSRTSAVTGKPKGLGRRNFAQGYPRSHATPTPTSRSKGQKSRWGGGILWRRPSRTAFVVRV